VWDGGAVLASLWYLRKSLRLFERGAKARREGRCDLMSGEKVVVGLQSDAGAWKAMRRLNVGVTGIDPRYCEEDLPDVDPVFRSSCCDSSYWGKK
jgi:hypothetical protein